MSLVGLIPSAGRGSRLAPLPTPKELYPVGYQEIDIDGVMEKRPKVISQYLVENLRESGVERIYIILGEGKSAIMEYYGNGSRFGVEIAYLYQEELNGMPHALALAAPWIADSTVLFGMPDTIMEPDNLFASLLSFHTNRDADLTLGLFETETPQNFGMVRVDESDNVEFTIDKPVESNLDKMWGCACWSSRFTGLLAEYVGALRPPAKESVLGDVFNFAIDNGFHVAGFTPEKSQYIDIGTTAELDLALKRFHL